MKIPEDCIDIMSAEGQTCSELYGTGANGKNRDDLSACLESVYSYRCNPPFVKEKTELGPVHIETEDDVDIIDTTVYKEFTKREGFACATQGCDEF